MTSYGSATIGEVPNLYAGNKPVQGPVAINGMRPGAAAGMLNAHIGMNYDTVEPVPERALKLAADGTPGLNGTGAFITWAVPPGVWVSG